MIKEESEKKETTILKLFFKMPPSPPPQWQKLGNSMHFILEACFFTIQGLFLDKILFDWTKETPTNTSTEFAIKKNYSSNNLIMHHKSYL